VREWGEAAARPLVFWHGLTPFGALQLNEAGPAWAARGFRVVAPAAPGLGESPAFADLEAYRPTRLADLIAALASELGLLQFAYVGWSWGASIGAHLAARHPAALDALVLLDAGHTDAADTAGWEAVSLEERIAVLQAEPVSFPSWDSLLEAARGRATAWRPALEERIRAGMEERDGSVVGRADPRALAAALHFLDLEPPSSTLAALAGLDAPILLVLASRNDTTRQVERFRAAVPAAETRTIDSEHDLLAHAPAATIELVAAWIDAASGTQPRVA
jgi:pimeloyl-ACP methyl ester carboxylesterase